MTFDNWMALACLAYVLFLLFGAPWLAEKQAAATLAKWDREDAEIRKKKNGK